MTSWQSLSSLRQIGFLSLQFWTGPLRQRAWTLTVAAVVFAIGDVVMQISINRWNKWFFDGLEQKSLGTITDATMIFPVLAFGATATVMAAVFFKLNIQIALRQHLTGRAIEAWLTQQAYYRLTMATAANFAPEHRVAEDVRLTVEPVVDLTIGFVTALITTLAFVGILWTVGGSTTIAGVTIPGFMVFAAIFYVGGITFLIAWFGRSYAQTIRQRSEAEARFRYDLTRLRENAESVALVRGEPGEQVLLGVSLAGVVARWQDYARTWTYMTWVTYANGLTAPVLPLLMMTPKYLSGEVTLGTMVQAAAAFGVLQGSLGWFPANFSRLSEWYAAATRVSELLTFIHSVSPDANCDSRIIAGESPDDALHLIKLSVALHDGQVLIDDADVVVRPGDMVMVDGESGAGKSTLVRAIAGLWPWGSGRILIPRGARIAFLPQRPYIPNGTLRFALAYPQSPGDVQDDKISDALQLTGLGHLTARLDDRDAWDKILSGGEQQRLAFARLLLNHPTIVILDEATSALDVENQSRLMDLFTTELFRTTVISVAHRPSLRAYHNRSITLHRKPSGSALSHRPLETTSRHTIRNALMRLHRIGLDDSKTSKDQIK